MPVYPYELPPPTIGSYNDSYTDTSKRTERDVGEDRVRPATSRPNVIVSLSWDYSQAQYATFRNWFNVFIKNGTEEFDIQLSNRSLTIEELGFFKARFTGVYEAAVQAPGDRWLVTAKLLVTSEEFNRVPDVLLSSIVGGTARVRGRLTVPTTLRAIVGGAATVFGRFAGSSPVELGAIITNTTATVRGVLKSPATLRSIVGSTSDVLGNLAIGDPERTTSDGDRRVTTDGDVRVPT